MELILLDELVEIRRQQLENKAQMILVDEGVSEAKNVVLVVRIALIVQLYASTISVSIGPTAGTIKHPAYQLKYGHFHHTLIKVRWLVFDHLHRNNLVCFHILTFDYLPKRALAQNVKNQVSSACCQSIFKWKEKDERRCAGQTHLCPSSVPSQSFT